MIIAPYIPMQKKTWNELRLCYKKYLIHFLLYVVYITCVSFQLSNIPRY